MEFISRLASAGLMWKQLLLHLRSGYEMQDHKEVMSAVNSALPQSPTLFTGPQQHKGLQAAVECGAKEVAILELPVRAQ